ncbi:Sad1 / UNC-like C-terminal [Plasmodiophora brassicae]
MSTWIGYCLPPLVSSVGQRANASLSIGVVAVLIGYVFKLQTDVATMATAIGKLSGTNPIQSGPSPVDEAVSSRIQELERAVQALSKAAANRRDPPAGALSVQDAVDRALWRFASDRTALIDYAMEAIGGRVLSSSGVHRGDGLGFIIQYLTWSGQDERQMLQPSMELGRCWPMPGKTGWAIIRLGRRVFVDGITMEHISPDSTPHFETAPKRFTLSVHERECNGTRTRSGAQLGAWEYTAPSIAAGVGPVQTFSFPATTCRVVSVNVSIDDNFGSDAYTCVYRVRIHGNP